MKFSVEVFNIPHEGDAMPFLVLRPSSIISAIELRDRA